MYLHLGQEITVTKEDIVGIFDLDTTTVSKHTRNYLKKAEEEGKIVNVSEELPKSFILCNKAKKGKLDRIIYLSQISTATLLKRSSEIKTLLKN